MSQDPQDGMILKFRVKFTLVWYFTRNIDCNFKKFLSDEKCSQHEHLNPNNCYLYPIFLISKVNLTPSMPLKVLI